ncbi:addiction module toxin RelE [Deinococcus arcticus]|uniref:Addiction module toxin RelE n=2 Tax=Deinococcus arcticus TaxID=2136176 RepID=A0A2T3W4W0_9DEIO|nr:addiction module toxin RelE [Deinococcus arcticus]
MPEEVIREFGFVLRAVQNGGQHSSIKVWKGEAGVYEIRISNSDSTFRTVYLVNLSTGIYVLHAFQKKSSTGIKTSQLDKDMVAARFSKAKQIHEELLAEKDKSNEVRKVAKKKGR